MPSIDTDLQPGLDELDFDAISKSVEKPEFQKLLTKYFLQCLSNHDEIMNLLTSEVQLLRESIKKERLEPNIVPTTSNSESDKKPVTVGSDEEKEFIEIDVENMDLNKFYLVNYDNEMFAVKKISDDKVTFCDVIQ